MAFIKLFENSTKFGTGHEAGDGVEPFRSSALASEFLEVARHSGSIGRHSAKDSRPFKLLGL